MTQNKLKKCKDCQGTVSINADKCPHCGAKLKQSGTDHFTSLITAVIILFAIFVIFGLIID